MLLITVKWYYEHKSMYLFLLHIQVSRIAWHFSDKFIFVSAFNAFRYSDFDIPYEVIEYPVNFKSKNVYAKDKLGFDKSWKHIVNVGLFTPRKNQKYVF